MTISIKPTASGSTIEQDGSTVLSVESDRSVDIDSGTLHVDATNNKVGIGTSNPSSKLEVNGTITIGTGTGTYQAGVLGFSDINFGFSYRPPRAGLIAAHSFQTFNGTRILEITESGNVGIGCTPSTWTLNPAVEVEVGSGIWSSSAGSFSMFSGAYYNSGWKRANATTKAALIDINTSGVISTLTLTTTGAAGSAITWTSGPYVANGGTSWTTPSDERLKNITSEIEDGLNKVCSLRAVNFSWKQDNSNINHVGLIAQDVNQILPEAVNTGYKLDNDETEYLGIQYTDVIPLLVAAIKELKTENDTLKSQLSDLETRIQALENPS